MKVSIYLRVVEHITKMNFWQLITAHEELMKFKLESKQKLNSNIQMLKKIILLTLVLFPLEAHMSGGGHAEVRRAKFHIVAETDRKEPTPDSVSDYNKQIEEWNKKITPVLNKIAISLDKIIAEYQIKLLDVGNDPLKDSVSLRPRINQDGTFDQFTSTEQGPFSLVISLIENDYSKSIQAYFLIDKSSIEKVKDFSQAISHSAQKVINSNNK